MVGAGGVENANGEGRLGEAGSKIGEHVVRRWMARGSEVTKMTKEWTLVSSIAQDTPRRE